MEEIMNFSYVYYNIIIRTYTVHTCVRTFILYNESNHSVAIGGEMVIRTYVYSLLRQLCMDKFALIVDGVFSKYVYAYVSPSILLL